jgi:hypothetical protein
MAALGSDAGTKRNHRNRNLAANQQALPRRYWKRGKPDASRLSEAVQTSEASDFIARFRLSRLEFGTRYDYEIYLDGLRLPAGRSFQTQAMWRVADRSAAVSDCHWLLRFHQ